MNPPTGDGAAAPARARVALLEVRDRDGRLLQTVDVMGWPLTLGRALDNDVVLVDPHVAAHHARITPGPDGVPLLQALPSRNGVRMEQGRAYRHLRDGEQAALGTPARCRLGHTMLTLRMAGDALPAERPLAAVARPAPPGRVPVLGAAVAALTLGAQWLDSDPDSRWLDYAVPLLTVAGGIGAWVLLWALLSKLFSGRFVVRAHLLLTLGFVLAISVSDFALPALAFAFDWPLLSHVAGIVVGVLAALLVMQQLTLLMPQHTRLVRSVVGFVIVASLGVQMVTNWQQKDRLLGELYAPRLFPPSWRLAPAEPIEDLTRQLRTLEQPLVERVRRAQAEDFEP